MIMSKHFGRYTVLGVVVKNVKHGDTMVILRVNISKTNNANCINILCFSSLVQIALNIPVGRTVYISGYLSEKQGTGEISLVANEIISEIADNIKTEND